MIDPNNPTANAQETFNDTYQTLSLWNGSTGVWDTNFWYNVEGDPSAMNTLTSNGEQEWYIDSQNAATAGVTPWTISSAGLSIKASPTPSSIASAVDNYPYISGELNTHNSFSQEYGLYEIDAKLPEGQGFWPAFWLLDENGQWPPELDVMENIGNPDTYYTTIHSTTLSGGQEAATDPITNPGGYNVYGMDWEPDYITFYINGQEVYQEKTPSDLDMPMYMEENLAVGGYWPGDANSSTNFNQSYDIAWTRVYQSNQNLANGDTPQGSAAYYGVDGSSTGSTGSSTGVSSTPNPGGSDSSATGDLLGHSQSDILMENANGAVAVAELNTATGQLGYTQISAIGSEWTIHGNGDFLGAGVQDQYILENANGAVDVGTVSNGATTYTQVGALGSEWSFQGTGNYLGDGKTDFLIENANGAVVVGEVGSNGQATYTQVGAVGSEWSFAGSGDFLGNGHDQFLMENTNGAVVVGDVENGQAQYTQVSALGSEWSFEGTGDFTGAGKDQFLIENTNGAVDVGTVSNGTTTYTQVSALGSEWHFLGTGDYNGTGTTQFAIENTAGVIDIGTVSNGQTTYAQVGAVGSEWTDPHSGSAFSLHM